LDALTTLAVLLAGGLIGATGIGGVLVVPALTQFAGLELPRAIAASSVAFALPGLAALWWQRRDGAGDRGGMLLLAGALPAALLGAALVHRVEARWLLGGLALLALFSGLRSLLPRRADPSAATPAELRSPTLAALGAGVGLGSALTGTGGPLLLVPALFLLRQPTPFAVSAAQAIQLPIALCAGAAHWASGALDVRLALLLGAVLLAGSLLGQAAARRLPVATLQALVSVLLVAVGLWFAWRVAALSSS
jgi:uncharacterized membrane protein YfcA